MNTPKKRFLHWIIERERARLCKETGHPYVGDKIIEQYRFCNVNREHDGVTQWIAKHVRPSLHSLPLADVVAQLYVCRIFNDPEVLADIFPWTTHKSTLKRLQKRRRSGLRLLRGAYLVVPHNTSADIEVYTMNIVAEIQKKFKPELVNCCRLEDVANRLLTIGGIGAFMANQICTDLRYQPGHDEWSDWSTFVLAGPGTRRGLARYRTTPKSPVKRSPKDDKVVGLRGDLGFTLRQIRNDLLCRVPVNVCNHFKDINNLANCFCEFDKYERARDGTASLRKYNQTQSS